MLDQVYIHMLLMARRVPHAFYVPPFSITAGRRGPLCLVNLAKCADVARRLEAQQQRTKTIKSVFQCLPNAADSWNSMPRASKVKAFCKEDL